MKLGFFLSCEEYGPQELVEQAVAAEAAGFEALWISDHFHPWNDEQGESPFVWSVIGALSQATSLPVTTAVTCPTMRINPVIVAQAAATSAVMLDGRFTLGIGTGEALNEHVLGQAWPSTDVRLEMLEEAVEVMRRLWSEDGFVNHRGTYYTGDQARIYTRPDQPVPVYMSGFGPKATEVAARIADGYISTITDTDLLQRFRDGSGGKPTQAGLKVAYAPTEDEGVKHAYTRWPNAGLPGELSQVLPSPRHFEQATELVTEDMIRDSVAAGPDPEKHLAAVKEYVDAGFDEVFVANMGPQPLTLEMIELFGKEVLPSLRA